MKITKRKNRSQRDSKSSVAQLLEKKQSFKLMATTLVKQAKLHDGIEALCEKHLAEIRNQSKIFKAKCLVKLTEGKPVFECAKQFYAMYHLYLINQTAEWGYNDYNLDLEGKWMQTRCMELSKYEAARRIIHLIKHPHRGFNPIELFHAYNATILVAKVDVPSKSAPPAELPDWKIAMLWDMYFPQQKLLSFDEAVGNLNVGNGSINYEIADPQYIRDILKERAKLLKEKKSTGITPEQGHDLEVITKVIAEVFGYNPRKNTKHVRCKSRLFKDKITNQAYSCVKMSIKRLTATFPADSIERQILDKNIRFIDGKFYWGEPDRFTEQESS